MTEKDKKKYRRILWIQFAAVLFAVGLLTYCIKIEDQYGIWGWSLGVSYALMSLFYNLVGYFSEPRQEPQEVKQVEQKETVAR